MSLLSYVIFTVPSSISNLGYVFFLTSLCHNTNDDGNDVDNCYFRPLSVNAVGILRVRIEVFVEQLDGKQDLYTSYAYRTGFKGMLVGFGFLK